MLPNINDVLSRSLDVPIWRYYAIFTQTGAGGGALDVRIQAANGSIFAPYIFGVQNTLAGAETITSRFINVSDSSIYEYLSVSAQTVKHDMLGGFHATDSVQEQKPMEPPVISFDDQLQVLTSALAQNDIVRLALRCYARPPLPTIDFSNSGGTVTKTGVVESFP